MDDEEFEARRARLRDPHTYAGIGEWWEAYRGFVPIQMAHGLSQAMEQRGITFAEAWDLLVGAGAIVMLDPPPGPPDGAVDDAASGPNDEGPVRRDGQEVR